MRNFKNVLEAREMKKLLKRIVVRRKGIAVCRATSPDFASCAMTRR